MKIIGMYNSSMTMYNMTMMIQLKIKTMKTLKRTGQNTKTQKKKKKKEKEKEKEKKIQLLKNIPKRKPVQPCFDLTGEDTKPKVSTPNNQHSEY